MSDPNCEKCHGKGNYECTTCHGEKQVVCEKCKGRGVFKNCIKCNSTGKVDCTSCEGTGKDYSYCSVCGGDGYIKKTRVINCKYCFGKGFTYNYSGDQKRCRGCGGSGQLRESYKEICPRCNGSQRIYNERPCPDCGGTLKVECSRCEGTGKARCQECRGSGKVTCQSCHGDGTEKCPDCEKKEKEAEERRKKKEREIREREDAKRRRENAIREKKEEEERKAKERKDAAQGCGCLLAIIALVAFGIWWWIEGFSMSAITDLWKSANKDGSLGTAVMVLGGLAATFIGWKFLKKNDFGESTSPKKRWKFITLGILFGFFGAHLAYAKRWFLFLLLWAGLIVGNVMSGDSNEQIVNLEKQEEAQTVEQAELSYSQQNTDAGKEQSTPIGNIGFAVWVLLWIGGALFIKKDGNGCRM